MFEKNSIINIMKNQLNCRYCGKTVYPSNYFCPDCGKKLKDKPLSAGIGKQISVYLLSVLLPPLGLWPAVGYLKQTDERSRMIGFIAIALTIIAVAIEIWLGLGFINTFNRELNQQLNGSLNLYR